MKHHALSSAVARLIRSGWGLLARLQNVHARGVRSDTDANAVAHPDAVQDELARALRSGVFRQPDDRACGAASLIVARMLLDPAYARMLLAGVTTSSAHPLDQVDVRSRFAAQSRLVHARTNRALGRISRHSVRVRMPWPRALGTPPWGVRDELRALTAIKYRILLIDSDNRRSRARAFAELARSVGRGLPAALFTGNDLSPRHVVAIIGAPPAPEGALEVFDPGHGVVVRMTPADFAGELGDVAWTRPWAVVVPVG